MLVTQQLSFTPREREIWSLVVLGLVKKEIAAKLNRSEHTVSMILRRLYAKLNVRKETELVREYFIYTSLVTRAELAQSMLSPGFTAMIVFLFIATMQLFEPAQTMRTQRQTCRMVRTGKTQGRRIDPLTDFII